MRILSILILATSKRWPESVARKDGELYMRATRKFGWSKNVLIQQIDNQSYQKSLLGQTTRRAIEPGPARAGQTGGEG